ncbi:MAG: SpoIIE family protein phosphatase [Oleiphilaceae bacterium]|nr:SpoIIE family protein phosphatase [Oleiphilaceae bacterium]
MSPSSDQILVIDSNPVDRENLLSYLTGKGYFVQAASNVETAHLLALPEAPDLIFADVPSEQIPLLPFFESDKKEISLIIVSEVESAGDVVACLRGGAGDFILKPVKDFERLDSVIHKTLDQIRLSKLNKRLRSELEERNRKLREGIHELRTDQKAGLQVQLKMLPQPDKIINDFHFDHIVRPSLYLSGDFLDYFRIDDTKSLFYFADVSGHGASSAFVTVLLKNLSARLLRNLRRNSSDELSCPVKFLKRLNQELIVSDLGKHLTVFVGIVDHSDRSLTYAIGGHFPLPILSSPSGAEYLNAKGVAVGLFPDPEFERVVCPLPQDFKITVFSDGILEVLPSETLKEKEKLLLDVVSRERGGIKSLLTSVGLDDIDDLPDDIAVLTVCDKDSS